MLTKLIKYDIRSTWRDFTGIFLAILLGVILVPMAMKNFSNELVQLTAGLVAQILPPSTGRARSGPRRCWSSPAPAPARPARWRTAWRR